MRLEKKNSNIKIGDILKRTRKSLGYTQEDVAEMLDLLPDMYQILKEIKPKEASILWLNCVTFTILLRPIFCKIT